MASREERRQAARSIMARLESEAALSILSGPATYATTPKQFRPELTRAAGEHERVRPIVIHVIED
jgi:hypothetical protein